MPERASALDRFQSAYADAFSEVVRGSSAVALEVGYELGRRAAQDGLGILDVAHVHHRVLSAALADARPGSGPALVAAAGRFLAENLSVFELARRSFTEVHGAVQAEQRHGRQMRGLAAAAMAMSSTLSVDEMLSILTTEACHLLGAGWAQVRLRASEDPAPGVPPPHSLVVTSPDHAAAQPGEAGITVPLTGRDGRRLGVVQVAVRSEWFDERDEAVLLQLAQLASAAIENARLYQREHLIAVTLQRSLLAEALPDVPGVRLAARYQPGAAGTEVGGDWYDAVALPGGRLAVAVGDVTGRGIQAAAVMGQLRMALRAYAVQDHPPADVVRSLDRLLQGLSDSSMATAVFAVVDPLAGRARVVNAGHPPPLLVDPDGSAAYLHGALSHPLGVLAEPRHADCEVCLPAGSTLVLYTDGLVEERGTSLDDGFARLVEAVEGCSDDVEVVADTVLERMLPAPKSDDVALLVVRV